jgi:hypothetical protein
MVPADVRLLEAKDLFVNQAALTGESMPVERYSHADSGESRDAFSLCNLCFMGSNVLSGYGTGVIIQTGARTFFGRLAHEIAGRHLPTAFDKGIDKFTWLMIRFILIMGPLVFLINGLTKPDWLEALLFALAVAVGPWRVSRYSNCQLPEVFSAITASGRPTAPALSPRLGPFYCATGFEKPAANPYLGRMFKSFDFCLPTKATTVPTGAD